MTDRLEEIRKRCDAATPGPWLDSPNYLIGGYWVQTPEQVLKEQDLADFVNQVDAVFIAHSREDIPYLLSELEKAKATAAEYKTDTDYDYAVMRRALFHACRWTIEGKPQSILSCENGMVHFIETARDEIVDEMAFDKAKEVKA